jgi:DNA (cytosine-5)-methyltransferase 1
MRLFFKHVDLLSGGLPCPPFSIAGKKLGESDERNLFPFAINIVEDLRPKAVLIENVKGILDPRFSEYLQFIFMQFQKMGYTVGHKLVNAVNLGVPQVRQRVFIVAIYQSILHFLNGPMNPVINHRQLAKLSMTLWQKMDGNKQENGR